ncbi:MAG: cysteine--tRNA ligase [Candidatus Omnitrophica bacterium]|nr:cysteine--tRNA ligase [Candidatus Omnitrophota bacterium]
MLRFFNTLTRKKEVFETIEDKIVKMYTCGPTVYDFAHIGNLRAYIFEDILHRFLEYSGWTVKRVMNITDIDDKTIAGAKKDGVSLNRFTEKYINAFFEDIRKLRIKIDNIIFSRATEHVPEMVSIIKILMEKGYAYKKENSIYFRISAFPGYGKLSHLDFSEIKTGASVDADEYEKESARDFVLWKGEKDDFSWDTEIGRGRPGWHIECSAMGMKYLGETFDMHTGGVDNIFPHHENEIAQCEMATGKPFVRYWLHCEHLLVNGEKMSKSKGNFYTLHSLLEKGADPVAIRYLLMTTHYRDPLNFTEKSLVQAKNTVDRWNDFYKRIKDARPDVKKNDSISKECIKAENTFREALEDDLNVSKALAGIFELMHFVNNSIAENNISHENLNEAGNLLEKVDYVLQILKPSGETIEPEILGLIEEREQARKTGDFSSADKIRNILREKGIILEDTPSGPRWKKTG